MLIDHWRIAGLATGRDTPLHDAVLERDELMILFVVVHRRRQVRGVAMEPIEMRRSDGICHRLEPVAFGNFMLLHPALAILPSEHIPKRQQRRRLRAHVSPDQTAEPSGRISDMLDLIFEPARLGLRRLLKTLAGAVELPTMIRAADPFLIDAAECQRRFAVRALLGDHAVATASVA